ILVTRGPPRAHLDPLHPDCELLAGELWRVWPRLYVFGHLNEGYGQERVVFYSLSGAYERVVWGGVGFAC
ncbi:hypothetical protein C8A00DRAFT_18505, partial [Chaetomidium leptoderma]